MMPTDLERRPADQEGHFNFSRERFRALVSKFQRDHLTRFEADELLDLLETAICYAERAERPGAVKKLRILSRGVESAKAFQERGIRA